MMIKGISKVLIGSSIFGLLLSYILFGEFSIKFALVFGSLITNILVISLISIKISITNKTDRKIKRR